jgi:hypothetical protein
MASDKKDELYYLLQQTQNAASSVEDKAQKLSQSARFTRDIAGCLKETIEALPNDKALPDKDWERYTQAWKELHGQTILVESALFDVNSFSALVSGTGLTMSNIYETYVLAEPPEPATVLPGETRFHQIINQQNLADEIRLDMARLGLDSAHGNNRSPLEQFEDAKSALEQPSYGEGSPVAILVALRECINSIIGELLRHRPTQDATPKTRDKIASIGRQCGHQSLSQNHFIRMGQDLSDLLNDLSGAKQAAISRDILMQRFERGVLFLKVFLGSIDEKRIRP